MLQTSATTTTTTTCFLFPRLYSILAATFSKALLLLKWDFYLSLHWTNNYINMHTLSILFNQSFPYLMHAEAVPQEYRNLWGLLQQHVLQASDARRTASEQWCHTTVHVKLYTILFLLYYQSIINIKTTVLADKNVINDKQAVCSFSAIQ